MSTQNIEALMLKDNITDQLNRLLTQLEDLEELRDELDEVEYNEEREDTLQQIQEFQAFLDRTLQGNMSLSDEISSAQKAIREYISENKKHTPAAFKSISSKGSSEIRKKLITLDRDVKLKTISKDFYFRQASDLLLALKRLGEPLTSHEEDILREFGARHDLESAGDGIDTSSLTSTATKTIQQLSK